ncbi:hypothetical protein [Halovivax ruber]|uniref:hypothetical protein n=1 Tax=Halovivax ruber TaxID=387341 RepID=UPI0014940F33|nr:hypothetical protein [Halovivax ruber]
MASSCGDSLRHLPAGGRFQLQFVTVEVDRLGILVEDVQPGNDSFIAVASNATRSDSSSFRKGPRASTLQLAVPEPSL